MSSAPNEKALGPFLQYYVSNCGIKKSLGKLYYNTTGMIFNMWLNVFALNSSV
jgi:hypothetical protein